MRIEKLDARRSLAAQQKKRVAIYARVSSAKDAAEDSLENQIKSFTEQIDARPDWELAETYADSGISGTVEMRPEFQRMLTDCRAGKIDLILTKSFTRFARNTVVLLETLRELKELGIEVVFEKDNIRTLSDTGELLITLLAAFAQAESQSASENQRWRIKKMFEEGKITGGVQMYGYRLKDGNLVVMPEEAEIVRIIFNDYLSGLGTNVIAKKLNSLNIPTLNGCSWNQSTIQGILANEKYKGELLLQKTYSVDFLRKKRLVNRGQRTTYLVENNHEAIVSKSIFMAVQEERRRRAEKAKPKFETPQRKHLFTSLIHCGKCGKCFCRRIANASTKYRKAAWICRTFNSIGKNICNNQQIPEKILIAKTAMVLGTEDLATAIPAQLDSIKVPAAGRLIYVFKDGTQQEITWENPSRRESWTPEMRQKARELSLAQHRKERKNV